MKMLVRPHNPHRRVVYNHFAHKKQTPIDLESIIMTTSTQIKQIHLNETELSRLR